MIRPPGWLKQWRSEQESAVWGMPPLYYKVWNWLKMNVDYKTGVVTATTTRIADRVAWTERNADRVPARTSIKRILTWLEAQNMVTLVCNGGRNSRYFTISLCNWAKYQEVVTGVVPKELHQEDGKVYDLKEVEEVQEVPTPGKNGKVYPQWTRDLLDEWEDEHELPSNVNIIECLDTFDKLERIDKHPVATIQRVVRRLIREKVPEYIRSPTKLRKPNKEGDEQTFKMYLVRFDAKSAPERDATVHTAIDTESWKKEL